MEPGHRERQQSGVGQRETRRHFLGRCVIGTTTWGGLNAIGSGIATAADRKVGRSSRVVVEKANKIYSTPEGQSLPYNSFTNLEFWRGKYYLAFRQGERHTPSRCRLIVLESADLERWSESMVLDRPKIDDRDPKLLATPERLVLYTVPYPKDTEWLATEDGINWTPPKKAYDGTPGDQFWKPKLHGGWYYVASDFNNDAVELLRSKDGLAWQRVGTIIAKTEYKPTETAIVFLEDGRCLAMMRLNGLAGSTLPGFAVSAPPFKKWDFELGQSVRFSGHAVERFGDTIVVASRAELGNGPGQWDFPRGEGIPKDRGHRTVLSTFDLGTMRLAVEAVLPTERGYDNSYCGMLATGKDRAVISWYDGDVKTRSDIWLAHLKIS